MTIEQNLGTAWAQLDVSAAQIDANNRQIEAARVAFEGLREEAKLGARTTLEVLDAEQEAQGEWVAQDIALEIVYEDEQILVLNKPAGLVVHPAAGHQDGTLLNALLHHVPELVNVPRAGIVHRLDKDTTGLMVVAKTLQAQTRLVEQLQARSVSRIYEAIVVGVVTAGGTIDAPIGRHGQQRQRMAVMDGGKPAVSHYRVLERFRSHTHVRVKLETGRTHQIRVHMAHVGFPLVGDPAYGGRFRIPPAASPSPPRKTFPRPTTRPPDRPRSLLARRSVWRSACWRASRCSSCCCRSTSSPTGGTCPRSSRRCRWWDPTSPPYA